MDLQVLDVFFAHLIDNDCTDDLELVYNLIFKVCKQFRTTLNGCWHRYLLRQTTEKIWRDLCCIYKSQIVYNAWSRYSGSKRCHNTGNDFWSETKSSFADSTVFEMWSENIAPPPDYYWHFYSQRLFKSGRFNFTIQVSTQILDQLDNNEKWPVIGKRIAPESDFVHLCFEFQRLLQQSQMHLIQLNSIEMRFLCDIANETQFKEIHFDLGSAMISTQKKRRFQDISSERLSITLPQGCETFGNNQSFFCSTMLLKRATQGIDKDLLCCKCKCLVQIGFYQVEENQDNALDHIAIALIETDTGKCFSFVKTS